MKEKRVFIASPSDCIYERNSVDQVISELGDPVRKLFGISLRCIRWENMPPIFNFDDPSAWQDQISRELETCDIFIGLLNRKYGTPISSLKGLSGTHYEFMQAISRKSDMVVLTYHRNYSSRTRVPAALKDLKGYLAKAGVPHQAHSSKEEFLKRIRKDLLIAIGESLSPLRKKRNQAKLFLLPKEPNYRGIEFKIVYPPIHATMSDTETRICNWRQRLMSDVIYEDYRAIEKIKTALLNVGADKVEAITSDSPGLDEIEGDIVWLCIPRNAPAQRHLRRIQERTRFRFRGGTGTNRSIEWTNGDGIRVRIKSPLAKYLGLQRPGDEIPWKSEYADVYARDFAVISRFKRGVNFADKPCYNYFMAGIRGLGTWGAGKFISHFHQQLADLILNNSRPGQDNHDDFQAIIQVTYNNRKIRQIVDVSNMNQEYFNNEMRTGYIKKRIKKHYHEVGSV